MKKTILYMLSKDMLIMPLYIKDPEVDELADEFVGLTKTSKVDAVKAALKREIASRRSSLPIRDRLAKYLRWPAQRDLMHPATTSVRPMKCGARTDAVPRRIRDCRDPRV
ncbi:type II toxin-antitoxin system VapB family antitoxin [Rhizobium sp. rho-13.1]|uniref:type II toxin-antitoxin system VapB family antitoxin n=1 Tax=Rhizobium sp. rho-13.1 TaxID=2506431 RepID=UPI0032AF9499